MRNKGFISIPIIIIGVAIIVGGLLLNNEIINKKIVRERTLIKEKLSSMVSRFGSSRLRQDGILGGAYTPVFPTSTSNWTENDIIEEEWANALESWIGTETPSNIRSLSFKLMSPTSTDPGHKHTTSTIIDINYVKPISEGGTGTSTPLGEQYLWWGDSSGNWAQVASTTVGYDARLYNITSSDTLRASADTGRIREDAATMTDWKMQKAIKIEANGNIRVKFDLRCSSGSLTVYGKIYLNGVPFGTTQTKVGDIYTTYTEDIAVNAYDDVELWTAAGAYSDNSRPVVSNFRIYYDKTPYSNYPSVKMD